MLSLRPCQLCHAENLPERRYCRQCGSSLELRCSHCGYVNRCGDETCAGCDRALLDEQGRPAGNWRPDLSVVMVDGPLPAALADVGGALAPERVVATENRRTTIVKADLSGFTAMSELLGDAEAVTDIMNQVFGPLVACVRRYGGHVDNYAGDMVIAFFGSPVTHEQDAERAVRAALDMRAEVEQLNTLNISHGVDLGISTGVATGMGLWAEIGSGASAKRTLSGEVGDYAAALEKYTDKGQVGFGPETCRRVAGRVACELQPGEVAPPGSDAGAAVYYAGPPAPLPTWMATLGDDTLPLRGRGERLDRMLELWERARQGRGRIVHLHGEAGSGKTRLLRELARAVQAEDGVVVAAGGHPLSQALGHDPRTELRDSVFTAHGVDPDDPAEQAAWLAELAAEPDGWLRAVAERGPCLVILDGLDHVPGLETLAGRLASTSAVVVLASRSPGLVASGAGALLTLQMPSLAPRHVAEMVADRLGAVDSAQLDAVLRWSEGNPLYVHEWCEWLRGGGRLDDEPEAVPWRLEELADQAVDALDEHSRAALFAAAVAADVDGLSLEPAVVRYLLELPNWVSLVDGLVAAGCLQRNGALVTFRHRVRWWVCRRRMLGSVRGELAARAAQAEELLARAT